MSAALSLELKLNQIIEKEISGTDKPDTELIEECSDALWRLSDSKKYVITHADYSGCVAALPGYRVRSKKKFGKTVKILLVAAILIATLSLITVFSDVFREMTDEEIARIQEENLSRPFVVYDFIEDYYLNFKTFYEHVEVTPDDPEYEKKTEFNALVDLYYQQIDDYIAKLNSGITQGEYNSEKPDFSETKKLLEEYHYVPDSSNGISVLEMYIPEIDYCVEQYKIYTAKKMKGKRNYLGEYSQEVVDTVLDYQNRMIQLKQDILDGKFESNYDSREAANRLCSEYHYYMVRNMNIPGM